MAPRTSSSRVTRRLFAAQLLFQFRVRTKNRSNQRRVCEIRTVLIQSRDGDKALEKATRFGKEEEFDYVDGARHVFFEFIGVKELLDLPTAADPIEVWWDLVVLQRPRERRAALIPRRGDLRAFSVVTKRRAGPKV